jgi:hypothetical protein
MRLLREYISGRRVSNTWMTCPEDEDNGWKHTLILDSLILFEGISKAPVLREGSAAYQLVGRVTAYQGEDG